MAQRYNSLTLEEKEKLFNQMDILPTFSKDLSTLLELLPLIRSGIISLGGDTSTSILLAMDLVDCALALAKLATKREDMFVTQNFQNRFPDIPWNNIRNNESPEDTMKRIEELLQLLIDERSFKDLMERIKNSIYQRSNPCTTL